MLNRFANVCKRVLAFVNVFKKKSSGASLCKSEILTMVDSDGRFISFISPCQN